MQRAKASRARRRVTVNRAPVLTLWASVVAERLGFRRAEALTLGRVVTGLNAYAKGRSLGLFQPKPKEVRQRRTRLRRGEELRVDLLGRAIPAVRTAEGLRALSRGRPVDPASVERYLEARFGDALPDARDALRSLARSRPPAALAREAWALYEAFRPAVPAGRRGWGAAGILDLDRVRRLAAEER